MALKGCLFYIRCKHIIILGYKDYLEILITKITAITIIIDVYYMFNIWYYVYSKIKSNIKSNIKTRNKGGGDNGVIKRSKASKK